MRRSLDIGAMTIDGIVHFRVWAPTATAVAVELIDAGALKIQRQTDGEYFQGSVPANPGDRYRYGLDGTLRRPDPVSRSQPDGVHGPSQVIDPAFNWSDSQ